MEFGEHERGARVAQGAAEFSNILVKYFRCVRKKGIEAFRNGRTLDEIGYSILAIILGNRVWNPAHTRQKMRR